MFKKLFCKFYINLFIKDKVVDKILNEIETINKLKPSKSFEQMESWVIHYHTLFWNNVPVKYYKYFKPLVNNYKNFEKYEKIVLSHYEEKMKEQISDKIDFEIEFGLKNETSVIKFNKLNKYTNYDSENRNRLMKQFINNYLNSKLNKKYYFKFIDEHPHFYSVKIKKDKKRSKK